MTDLLTAKQLAHKAGCHISYIQRARRVGELTTAATTYESNGNQNYRVYWYSPDAIEVMREAKRKARENKLNRRIPATAIRYCREPHLASCDSFPKPYPCTRYDLPDACELCADRYRIVSSGASSGWTTEVLGAGRIR